MYYLSEIVNLLSAEESKRRVLYYPFLLKITNVLSVEDIVNLAVANAQKISPFEEFTKHIFKCIDSIYVLSTE